MPFHGSKVLYVGTLLCAFALVAQSTSDLSKEDARLNENYKQRVAQLQSDPAGLAALRSRERAWIKQRDQKCGKDAECLLQETKTQADYLADEVSKGRQSDSTGAPIPKELLGKWIIRKYLPTQGVTCWGNEQVKTLIGTTIEYRSDNFLWKETRMQSQGAKSSEVTAQAFMQNNSGSGGTVDFKQLGITTPTVRQIEIQHPDASVFGKDDCCSAVPGETVMMKGPDAFVFDVCGTYYEATRAK